MGAGVADRVLVEITDVDILVHDVELQHVHTGDMVALAQGVHFRCYHAEVLGDDRQVSEGLFHRVENRVPGAWFPGADPGGAGIRGHGPVGFEAAKMIDAHEVGQFGRRAQAVDPPAVAGLAVAFPVVKGIAPELAVGAEIVRRHARHVTRPAFLVELQDVAVGPRVGTVERDVDRHVAEEVHACFVGMLPQRLPLVKEHALDDFDQLDLAAGGLLELAKCAAVPVNVLRRPLRPGAIRVTRFQDPEQGVIVQPIVVVLRQEVAEGCFEFGAFRLPETLRRQREQPALDGDQRTVIDAVCGQGCQFTCIIMRQQPLLDEVANGD